MFTYVLYITYYCDLLASDGNESRQMNNYSSICSKYIDLYTIGVIFAFTVDERIILT